MEEINSILQLPLETRYKIYRAVYIKDLKLSRKEEHEKIIYGSDDFPYENVIFSIFDCIAEEKLQKEESPIQQDYTKGKAYIHGHEVDLYEYLEERQNREDKLNAALLESIEEVQKFIPDFDEE